MSGPVLLPHDQLWSTVAAVVRPLGVEEVDLSTALLRVLRADAQAVIDLPLADNSAMDGFAVRSVDTAEAPDAHLELVQGDAYAGTACDAVVGPGQAVPIGTGGVIPEGADAVAVKEIVTREQGRIRVAEPVAVGAHIRRRGEELAAGDVVLRAGSRLDAGHLAAAGAAGVTTVKVGTRPRVAVVATGSELVPIGSAIRPGQVVNTNSPYLGWQVERLLGQEPTFFGGVADDPERHHEVLHQAFDGRDVVLLSGGVSVGDRDLVKTVLEAGLGVERVLWKVAQKPGKPLYVGRRGQTIVVGLPGNPAAVVVGYWLVVRPLLLALMGAREPEVERVPVRLAEAQRCNSTRAVYLGCRGRWQEGELWAEAVGRSGSHMLSGLVTADLLITLPPGGGELPVGARLQAVPVTF